MKLPDNLRKRVTFVTGPEERGEPTCEILAKPYKALNNAAFRFFLGVPLF